MYLSSQYTESKIGLFGDLGRLYSDVLLSWPPSSSQIPSAETCRETASLWLNCIPSNSSVFFSHSKFNLGVRLTFRGKVTATPPPTVDLTRNRRHNSWPCDGREVRLALLWFLCSYCSDCSINRCLWRESVSLARGSYEVAIVPAGNFLQWSQEAPRNKRGGEKSSMPFHHEVA